jgi:hypothetical protein
MISRMPERLRSRVTVEIGFNGALLDLPVG